MQITGGALKLSDERIFELLQVTKLLQKIRSSIDDAVEELLNKHQIVLSQEESEYIDSKFQN